MLYDFEFHFANGAMGVATAMEGRDEIGASEERIRLLLRPDAQTIEEIIVNRPQLVMLKTIKRIIPAENAPVVVDGTSFEMGGTSFKGRHDPA